jgi:uncharacterized membrane protein
MPPVSHMSARPDERVAMLDLLRLVAAFQMIQGHTIDAVLDAAVRRGPTFELWTSLRGLTAVAFLFVAGSSFHLATIARLERHRSSPEEVRARFRRVGVLFGLGYLLHLPVVAWVAGEPAGTGAWVVDILQCMATCLAVAELLALWLRSAQSVALACGSLAVLALALAPILRVLEPLGPWAPLVHYLSPRGGAPFPLLPWGAHFFAGAALGGVVLVGPCQQRALRLGLAGLIGIGLAAVIAQGTVADHVGRLGRVLIVAAALSALEPRVGRLPSWAALLSRSTLTLYVVHIVLVYGEGVGLGALVGPTLALGRALAVTALVAAFSVAAALAGVGRMPGRLAARIVPG